MINLINEKKVFKNSFKISVKIDYSNKIKKMFGAGVFKLNGTQCFAIYGGFVLGAAVFMQIFSKRFESYTPKSTNSSEWESSTRKYMKIQDMSPSSLGYTPSYLKKKKAEEEAEAEEAEEEE